MRASVDQRWTDVPDVATPKHATAFAVPVEAQDGEQGSRLSRVRDADGPTVRVGDPDGDVAVGVDDRGHAGQEIERPVGQPALGHAVEIEAQPGGTLDRRAATAASERPAAGGRGSDRRAPSSSGVPAVLGAASRRAARCRRSRR